LIGRAVDVLDETAVAKLVDETGAIDVLVNTVGAYVGGVALWKLVPADFDRMLNLNLRTGYLLARAVVPGMLKRGSGAVVNVSAKAALDHGAGASAYAASKAASLALMDSLAADTRGTGVRVNSVLPSIIDTSANRQAMPGAKFDVWPKPEDIAKVILFLASDAAKVVHGAAITVYGES
jgi:NAD(P)-dependent dehydrogenase (short-subunit alcohol dehydrogenase family)